MPLYPVPLKTPVWSSIPLDTSGGVTQYPAPWQLCQYYKDPFGFVRLRGLCVPPSGFSVLLGIMPSALKPLSNQMFACMGYYDAQPDNIAFRVDIDTNGQIIVQSTSGVALSHNYFSMSGICYAANQA